jgi:hypothetical protein
MERMPRIHPRLLFTACLAVAILAGAAGFAGGRALSATEGGSHFQAGSRELDRSEAAIRRSLFEAGETIKAVSRSVTLANAEATKVEREGAMGAAIRPVQEDALLLLLQGHLLAIDNIADEGGAPAELFLQQVVYENLQVEAEEVARRRADTGLSHGGLILGYLTARVAGTTPDQIFSAKKDQSWPELLRERKVSVAALVKLLDGG